MSLEITLQTTRVVTVERDTSSVTTVVSAPSVSPVQVAAPVLAEIDRVDGEVDLILAGQQGPRGPQGIQGPPGPVADEAFIAQAVSTAVDAVVPGVVAEAIAAHEAAPDPHPVYIDSSDTIDGGNF